MRLVLPATGNPWALAGGLVGFPRPLAPACMASFEPADRSCPNCEQKGYMFRARRTIDGKPGEGTFVETKYRCRACSHEW
ncbi:hypothetical protein J0H58_08285 [bacterium]|nr:hypothetical protein [bacterium]